MLVFAQQSLAFIAVPKTGTTAVEMALKRRADIVFTKRFKHMTAQRFHSRMAPLLDEVYGLRPDRFAVMRDPEEQIRSWFRYRSRKGNRASDTDAAALSFDDFVKAVIADDPPAFAGIGSQDRAHHLRGVKRVNLARQDDEIGAQRRLHQHLAIVAIDRHAAKHLCAHQPHRSQQEERDRHRLGTQSQ